MDNCFYKKCSCSSVRAPWPQASFQWKDMFTQLNLFMFQHQMQVKQMCVYILKKTLVCLTIGLRYEKQMEEGLGNLDQDCKQQESSSLSHYLAAHVMKTMSACASALPLRQFCICKSYTCPNIRNVTVQFKFE